MTSTLLKTAILAAIAAGLAGCGSSTPSDPNNANVPKIAIDRGAAARDEIAGKSTPAPAQAPQGKPGTRPKLMAPPS